MKQRPLLPALFALILLTACNRQQPLFRLVPAEESGITFRNDIKEDERFNIINYEYIYNGGGVGVGDFNNDSLPDIYFVGNMTPHKLYLNRGNMKFEDVSEKSGITALQRWTRGVSLVDINNDGLLDVYVCNALFQPGKERRNFLYVNQRIDPATGIPQFKEMGEEYGLADTSHSHMAAFFDYDNDGDLDVYLLVNELVEKYPGEYRPIRTDGSIQNTDRLLRNDWNESLGHGVFTNVSATAGITWEGYGLGVQITDINNDGWKDVYVSNDYLTTNLLYINNRNGTFTNQYDLYFKHSSLNAMGNDVADINNDGLLDVVELDMAAEDNHRLKLMLNAIDYQTLQAYDYYGYNFQSVRNMLQVNMGPRVLRNDSIGPPVFAEIGNFANIARTDWSWGPLLADVDNDGWRDLMVSNGFPRDVSDQDFIAYRNNTAPNTPNSVILQQIPEIKISNYIYRNNGDLSFSDQTLAWGWDQPSFSAGMAYADFDRDGDLDVVINNTNMEASLLENTLSDQKNTTNHYLQIQLQGDEKNIQAIGAITTVFFNGQKQVHEYTPYRGYMSTVENMLHVGLGTASKADSLHIIWPNGKFTSIKNIAANQRITLRMSDAKDFPANTTPLLASNNLFTDITDNLGFSFLHTERDFIDFNVQKLLPHKLSSYGPSLAAGDVNGDGNDDLIIGGSYPTPTLLMLQQPNGTFQRKTIGDTSKTNYSDDMGLCLFDADSDGDLDLYIAAGGYEFEYGSPAYTDRIWINDGKGNFTLAEDALPNNLASKSCVKAADFDGDGDLDLFVGGRVMPHRYPLAENGYLLRNDSKNGYVKFTDVSASQVPEMKAIGLICDAIWSDYDNDGDPDLLLAGEWMPPMVFQNNGGNLKKIKTGLEAQTGWWNSITGADLDNDGDMDYVLGNYGTNGFFKASNERPVGIYAGDFDQTGTLDAVFSNYIPTKMHGQQWQEYPANNREDMIKEMSYMKGRFTDHNQYAAATMEQLLTADERKQALILKAKNLSSCWIENKGKEGFVMHTLPAMAQWSPVYGICADDFDGDGNSDIILNGNEFSMSAHLGRHDALNGLLLSGDGKGGFQAKSILESGIFIPGNGKALLQITINGMPAIAASQNNGRLKFFKQKKIAGKLIQPKSNETAAILQLKNGKKRRVELSYGSSFLSQSARGLWINDAVATVTFLQNQRATRTLSNL